MRQALAIDIGGTNVRVGVIDACGHLVDEMASAPVPFGTDGIANLDGILDLVEPLMLPLRRSDDVQLLVGVSLCGNIDADGNSTLNANLGWRDVPFRARAEARFKRPVRVLTDVRSAALAEAVWGAGRGVRDFVWVTLGTGYGAHLVLDGRIYGGAHGSAGNLGHSAVGPDDALVCGCGGRGCVETLVSGPAIARAGAAAVRTGRATLLRELAGAGQVSASMVIQACVAHDPVAREIIDAVVEALVLSLRQTVNLLDPSLLIFGGGVVRAAPWLVAMIEEQLRPRLMTPEARRDLRLVVETFDDSALWGAAAHAFGLQPM